MAKKPSYDELEQRVQELEEEAAECKRMEGVLREAKVLLEKTLASLDQAVFVVDPAIRTIITCNPAVERIFGYTEQEALGRNTEFLHVDRAMYEEFGRNLFPALDRDGVYRTEFQMRRKDGSIFYTEHTVTEAHDESGRRTGTVSVVRDITRRKEAEEALRRAHDEMELRVEQRTAELAKANKQLERQIEARRQVEEALRETRDYLDSLINYASAPIVVWSPEFKITRFNHAFEHLTGYIAEEVIGKELGMLFPEASRDESLGKIARTLQGESWESVEIPVLRKDGDIRIALWNSANIYAEDGTTVIATIAQGIDMTERLQAEEALRASKETLSAILEAAPLPILTLNLEGRVDPIWNPAAERTLGWKKEEVLGKPYPAIPPGKEGEFARNLERALSGEGIRGTEARRQRRDGTPIDYNIYTAPLHDIQGCITGLVAILLDTTERKRAEEALKESEQKYKILTENSLTGVHIHRDGKYVFVNDRFAQIHGYKREELLGKRYLTLVHPDQRELVEQRASQRLKGVAVPPCYEIQKLRKDGKTIWCEMMVTRIQYRGKPAIMGNTIDITERKQAEEALSESEERLKALIENAPDGIYVIDSTTGRFIDGNRKAEEFVGYPREELIGKNFVEAGILLEEYIPKALEGLEKNRQGQPTGPDEYQLIRKDGLRVSVEIMSFPVARKGKVEIMGVARDITDRKQAEEERKKLEAQFQAAQRMEALGTLAGGIAHNFNNLLMAIQGNASLMLLETDPAHPSYERLKNIEKSVQSGSKLTRQLLGYAREGRYEIKPMSLNQVVEETSYTFGSTKKHLTVHRDLAKDLWGIKADQGQIEQALLNLYVNAADAMPGGGDLFLKTMNVTHSDMRGRPYTVKPGNYILLTVRDTGTGMDKKTMERVFDPFFTTKGLARGTGLGLASVYGIVKAHGGYIDVDSKKGQARPPRLSPAERDDGGQGTTFSIYLPASQERVEKPLTGPEHIVEGGETILLVDDEEMVLEVGAQLLKTLGYTVLEAKGGTEAIELYRENRDTIALVLLDMIMPDMGGGDTYDRMKELNPNIKVLLSSGYSIDGQATEILDRGCDGFIQKPFSMEQLSRSIREILDTG